MTQSKLNNPPAFPIPDCAAYQYHGMSLRDYFAGQALAGIAQCMGYDILETKADFAKECYAVADAMLAEREKTDDTE